MFKPTPTPPVSRIHAINTHMLSLSRVLLQEGTMEASDPEDLRGLVWLLADRAEAMNAECHQLVAAQEGV